MLSARCSAGHTPQIRRRQCFPKLISLRSGASWPPHRLLPLPGQIDVVGVLMVHVDAPPSQSQRPIDAPPSPSASAAFLVVRQQGGRLHRSSRRTTERTGAHEARADRGGGRPAQEYRTAAAPMAVALVVATLLAQTRSESFPLRVTGWPVELMAYAFLVVSPPDMSQRFEEMAVAASNKSSSKPGLSYPDLEEQALQFILDYCESNIEKYTKYFEGGDGSPEVSMNAKQANRTLLLKQRARDLCISERRILYHTQYILRRRLRDMRGGKLRALSLFNGLRKLFK